MAYSETSSYQKQNHNFDKQEIVYDKYLKHKPCRPRKCKRKYRSEQSIDALHKVLNDPNIPMRIDHLRHSKSMDILHCALNNKRREPLHCTCNSILKTHVTKPSKSFHHTLDLEEDKENIKQMNHTHETNARGVSELIRNLFGSDGEERLLCSNSYKQQITYRIKVAPELKTPKQSGDTQLLVSLRQTN
eukprot:403158_1